MLLHLSCSSPEGKEGKEGRKKRRKKKEKGEERREARKGEALQIMIYTLGRQSPPSPPLPLSPPSSSYQKFSENVGRHYTPHPSSSLPSYSILLLLLSLPPSHLHPTLPPLPSLPSSSHQQCSEYVCRHSLGHFILSLFVGLQVHH